MAPWLAALLYRLHKLRPIARRKPIKSGGRAHRPHDGNGFLTMVSVGLQIFSLATLGL
jgi:hypothetical protein